MIENVEQLKITLEHAERFERSIEQAIQNGPAAAIDPLIWRSYIAGMQSMLTELQKEVHVYLFDYERK